jgi:two-component system response regulator DevR
MIRVAVLDDHPLVLASLEGLLQDAAGLQPVIAAADGQQLWRQLDDARPDVVVLDYDLARGDGLTLCQRLKERVRPPAVVIYSAYAGPSLALSARIAGADSLVDKRAPASELLDAIRGAADGESRIPDTAPDAREAVIAQLASSDVPVASMLLAGTSHQGIAETLATDRQDVVHSVRRIVGQLRPTVGPPPRPTPGAYCRRCGATFERPLPQPYGAICQTCLADGEIVTLTDSPPRRMSPVYATVADCGPRALGEGSSDA